MDAAEACNPAGTWEGRDATCVPETLLLAAKVWGGHDGSRLAATSRAAAREALPRTGAKGMMDVLILTPPACTPAEPAAGAFLLAAALTGHGADVALLDLSLELYWRWLAREPAAKGGATASLRYLLHPGGDYDPERHRNAAGQLGAVLRRFGQAHPGWRLSLMDLAPPWPVHSPSTLLSELPPHRSPFTPLWEEALAPALATYRPRRVVISLAYLSQLTASVDLVRWLRRRGVGVTVGGSLPRSLARTGAGLSALREVSGALDLGDGSGLLPRPPQVPLLHRLSWPRLLSKRPYLSSRPIVPLTLSLGCPWGRCRFCPDRDLPFEPVPVRALVELLEGLPAAVLERGPVVHLLDSAVPPVALDRFAEAVRGAPVEFYGFARPTPALLRPGRMARIAEAGGRMLQLGVESGSDALLRRYDKGLAAGDAEAVLRACREHGVRTYVYLLLGLPGEREADRLATLDLLRRSADAVDFVNLSLFNLPATCAITAAPEDYGVELLGEPVPESLRLYRPFTEGGRDQRGEARTFLQRTLGRDPIVRPMIRRTPRWLRAAHLALMAQRPAVPR